LQEDGEVVAEDAGDDLGGEGLEVVVGARGRRGG